MADRRRPLRKVSINVPRQKTPAKKSRAGTDHEQNIMETHSSHGLRPMEVEANGALEPARLQAVAGPQAQGPIAIGVAFPFATIPLDSHDLTVLPYEDTIFRNAVDAQARFKVDPQYMAIQPEITFAMRSILIDWLVEVGQEFSLLSKTIFLAVSLLDRFLARVQLNRARLQLAGITSMHIAVKVEEVFDRCPLLPGVDAFINMTDNSYTREEMVIQECAILHALSFDIMPPTPFDFEFRLFTLSRANPRTRHIAQFLWELLLQEQAFLRYSPLEVACAGLWLAHRNMQLPPWPAAIHAAVGVDIDMDSMILCVQDMQTLLLQESNPDQRSSLRAVRQKYQSPVYSNVASLTPVEIERFFTGELPRQ